MDIPTEIQLQPHEAALLSWICETKTLIEAMLASGLVVNVDPGDTSEKAVRSHAITAACIHLTEVMTVLTRIVEDA